MMEPCSRVGIRRSRRAAVQETVAQLHEITWGGLDRIAPYPVDPN